MIAPCRRSADPSSDPSPPPKRARLDRQGNQRPGRAGARSPGPCSGAGATASGRTARRPGASASTVPGADYLSSARGRPAPCPARARAGPRHRHRPRRRRAAGRPRVPARASARRRPLRGDGPTCPGADRPRSGGAGRLQGRRRREPAVRGRLIRPRRPAQYAALLLRDRARPASGRIRRDRRELGAEHALLHARAGPAPRLPAAAASSSARAARRARARTSSPAGRTLRPNRFTGSIPHRPHVLLVNPHSAGGRSAEAPAAGRERARRPLAPLPHGPHGEPRARGRARHVERQGPARSRW